MTREEAIDLLDNLIGMVDDNHDSDYDTAIKMAIKALEQEPCDDVLNKITGELKSAKKKWWYGVNDDCFMKLLDVLDIIDKYKTESEAAE